MAELAAGSHQLFFPHPDTLREARVVAELRSALPVAGGLPVVAGSLAAGTDAKRGEPLATPEKEEGEIASRKRAEGRFHL